MDFKQQSTMLMMHLLSLQRLRGESGNVVVVVMHFSSL
jgi:hypothetical protein